MQCACWKKLADMDRRRKSIKILFGLYGLMMLWLLLFRRIGSNHGQPGLNLEPLDTVKRYLWVLQHSTIAAQRQWASANLLGNVGLFLPFGIFLPLLFQSMKHFWRFLLCATLSVLTVELLQLLTGLGACDVDDLILNLSGAIAGWLIWKIGAKRSPGKKQ